MIYRKAKLEDVPAIVELAVISVSNDPLPVKIDRLSMSDTAKVCLNPAHFLWVAEDEDGKIVAAFAACVQKSFGLSACSARCFCTTQPSKARAFH